MGSCGEKRYTYRWDQVAISRMALVTDLEKFTARHLHPLGQVACEADKLDRVIGRKYHAWLAM